MLETICAISTPSGNGGIGIIRLSGATVLTITRELIGFLPPDRIAIRCEFIGKQKIIIDNGIVIFYRSPNSFTGEDVIELHCHGNKLVINIVLESVLFYGARLALPGEFSLRAFLNKKISLFQVEAIYKMTTGFSFQSLNFLKLFDKRYCVLFKQSFFFLEMIIVRFEYFFEISLYTFFKFKENFIFSIYVLLCNTKFLLKILVKDIYINKLFTCIFTGCVNVGKSSLINTISKKIVSIVTSIPGTTRDLIKTIIHINNNEIQLVDTAGYRIGVCGSVELYGIFLLKKQLVLSNLIIMTVDFSIHSTFYSNRFFSEIFSYVSDVSRIIIVVNKIDVKKILAFKITTSLFSIFFLSAKNSDGLLLLEKYFRDCFLDFINKNDIKKFSNDVLNILTSIITCLDKITFLYHQFQYDLILDLLKECYINFGTMFSLNSQSILEKIFAKFCIGK